MQKNFVLLLNKLESENDQVKTTGIFILLKENNFLSAQKSGEDKFKEIKRRNLLIIQNRIEYLSRRGFSHSPSLIEEEKKLKDLAEFWEIAEMVGIISTEDNIDFL